MVVFHGSYSVCLEGFLDDLAAGGGDHCFECLENNERV
jgi:hypothetical protein